VPVRADVGSTQPFPTLAAAVCAAVRSQRKDINPHLAPEAQEKLRQLLRNSGEQGALHAAESAGQHPDTGETAGGANWGLLAADPVKGPGLCDVEGEAPALLLTLRAMKPGRQARMIADPIRIRCVPGAPSGFVPYTAVNPYGFMRDPTTGFAAAHAAMVAESLRTI
jgi:hypothetical protein